MSQIAEARLPPPPILDMDPFSDDTIRDPSAFHQALRETAPVVYIEKYGMYAVGRYDEVRTVMSDFARFTSEGGIGLSDIRKPGAWRSPSPITEVDPPRHTAVRGALTKILSPIVIRKWREHFSAEAERLAEEVAGRGDIEAVKDLAEAFVLKVFPDVLGVDMPRDNFIAIGDMNFNQIGPNNDNLKRSLERVEPILDQYQKGFQREGMIAGGFGEKIFQAEDAGDFAPGTAGVQVRSFLRAGVDTTIAGIGHTLNLLARHPDQWAKCVADPLKVRGAFEEGIRLHSPSQVMFRTTTGEQTLSGYRLAPDVKIGNFMGAANRDPRKFDDPDRFDIDRDAAGIHLALGTGAHICIGQMIARLEAECILGALARRVARIDPAGEPEYRLVNTLRTLDRLPLRLVRK
ncbi:MAG: cytochrome P450 [Rhizobiaceae bacterium]|nr:cytochrome P450 [Rhizobiaceae bacterium]MCV0404929.1 cytochrome P450 [Rhizobiaceae bacterium]